MRRAAALVLLASLAGAEPGRFEDGFWNVRYEAPELRGTLATAPPGFVVLFRGRCRGGLTVEITVHEAEDGDASRPDAAGWLARARAGWKKAGRKLDNVEEDAARGTILFTERKLGVFEAHHGHRFVVRGPHAFEVHAWIDDRTETSGDDIRAALAGIEVGEDPGCGVVVLRVAKQAGRDPLDAEVLLAAGIEYLEGGRFRRVDPALAARVLARLRARLAAVDGEPGAMPLEGEDVWRMHRFGGEAHLRAGMPKEAVDWLRAAETVATEKALPGTRYALARAAAQAGDLDLSFEALDRAFDGAQPATKAQLSQDEALEPLRRDPRWEQFWKKRVR